MACGHHLRPSVMQLRMQKNLADSVLRSPHLAAQKSRQPSAISSALRPSTYGRSSPYARGYLHDRPSDYERALGTSTTQNQTPFLAEGVPDAMAPSLRLETRYGQPVVEPGYRIK